MTTTPMTDNANATQVGGDHYKCDPIEHWDIVALLDLDYFQGQITKYVIRWRRKKGVEDLKKAMHFLQKYIELQEHDGGKARILADATHKVANSEVNENVLNSTVERISEGLMRDAERYRWLREQRLSIIDGRADRPWLSGGDGRYLDDQIDRILQSDQREAIRHQEGD